MMGIYELLDDIRKFGLVGKGHTVGDMLDYLYCALARSKSVMIPSAESLVLDEALRIGNLAYVVIQGACPHEEDIVREYYWQDYYDDPDAEGDYPSEIFDDREDYSEEHVRGNFGVAGED